MVQPYYKRGESGILGVMIAALLDWCKARVRRVMRGVARVLNKLTGGRIRPNTVTLVGLAMHVPIAVLIATRHPLWAAGLLVIFGLLDTLDGELARLQGTTSAVGMFLDSTTDRMKEIILYVGIGYRLLEHAPYGSTGFNAAVVVAACGGSILVSYINAWGDAVMSSSGKRHTVNQAFRGGIMRFEVRMTLLVIGLLTDMLFPVVVLLAVSVGLTAIGRMYHVIRRLA
jgi:CDP-diacylglycerol--glycerol-3-phosphate 3-phosphatidyltransferase